VVHGRGSGVLNKNGGASSNPPPMPHEALRAGRASKGLSDGKGSRCSGPQAAVAEERGRVGGRVGMTAGAGPQASSDKSHQPHPACRGAPTQQMFLILKNARAHRAHLRRQSAAASRGICLLARARPSRHGTTLSRSAQTAPGPRLVLAKHCRRARFHEPMRNPANGRIAPYSEPGAWDSLRKRWMRDGTSSHQVRGTARHPRASARDDGNLEWALDSRTCHGAMEAAWSGLPKHAAWAA